MWWHEHGSSSKSSALHVICIRGAVSRILWITPHPLLFFRKLKEPQETLNLKKSCLHFAQTPLARNAMSEVCTRSALTSTAVNSSKTFSSRIDDGASNIGNNNGSSSTLFVLVSNTLVKARTICRQATLCLIAAIEAVFRFLAHRLFNIGNCISLQQLLGMQNGHSGTSRKKKSIIRFGGRICGEGLRRAEQPAVKVFAKIMVVKSWRALPVLVNHSGATKCARWRCTAPFDLLSKESRAASNEKIRVFFRKDTLCSCLPARGFALYRTALDSQWSFSIGRYELSRRKLGQCTLSSQSYCRGCTGSLFLVSEPFLCGSALRSPFVVGPSADRKSCFQYGHFTQLSAAKRNESRDHWISTL